MHVLPHRKHKRRSLSRSICEQCFDSRYLFLESYAEHNTVWQKAVLMSQQVVYTGCHRRNGPNFGRVFLMLNYTDITQNTYIQSWTVTEIMAIEKCGLLWCPRTVSRPWRHIHPLRKPGNEKPLLTLECSDVGEITDSCCLHQLLGNLRQMRQ